MGFNKLGELEADPLFANLSYNEQTLLRKDFFDKKIATTPEYGRLDLTARNTLLSGVLDKPPVLKNPESDKMRQAAELTMRMQLGDPNALDEAINASAMRNALKQTLIPTLALKGADLVAGLFDPDRHDTYYGDSFGSDGDKIDQWLQKNVAQRGGPQATATLADKTTLFSVIGGFAEFGLEALALGGVGGVVGKAVGASKAAAGVIGPGLTAGEMAAKGSALGSSLLTGARYGELARVALENTKLSSALVKNLAAIGVEGAVSGGVTTGLDVLRMALQDELATGRNKDVLDTIATEFGMNVALNYVGWGVIKAMGTVGKGLAKAAKDYDDKTPLDKKGFVEDFATVTGDQPATKGVSPEFYLDVLAKDTANLKAKQIGYKTIEGLQVNLNAVGWDIQKQANGKFKIWKINDPKYQIDDLTHSEAATRFGEIANSGQPTVFKGKGVVENARALGSLTDSRTRLYDEKTMRITGNMNPEDIFHLALPVEGKTVVNNLKLFGREYLVANGVDPKVAATIDVIQRERANDPIFSKEMQVVVDQAVTGAGDEAAMVRSYLSDLDKIVKAQGKVPRTDWKFAPPDITYNHSSYTALKAAGEALGVPINISGRNIEVAGAKVKDIVEGNAMVIRAAYDQGKLTLDQIAAVLAKRHGVTLKKVEVDEFAGMKQSAKDAAKAGGDTSIKTTKYTLSKAGKGKTVEVAVADDIETLFKQVPEYDIRIPSPLAPDYWLIDDSLTQIKVQSTVASGNVVKLLELSSKFSSPETPKTLLRTSKGSVEVLKDRRIFVRNDIYGVVGEFSTKGEATQYLTKARSDIEALRDGFAMRDLRIEHLPDGTILAHGADDHLERFKDLPSARKWLDENPYSEWIKEAAPVSDEFIAKTRDELVAVDPSLRRALQGRKLVARDTPWGMKKFYQYLFPTEQVLIQNAKRHGKTALLDFWREIRTGWRIVQGADTKAGAAVNAIGRGVSDEDARMIQLLLGVDERRWDEVAKKGYNTTLTPKHREVLGRMQQFYQTAFEAAGISDWKRVMTYAPRIREWLDANKSTVGETVNATELLGKVFQGGVPNVLGFFGDNARATEVIQHVLLEDFRDVALSYTRALNKNRIMEPMIRKMKEGLKKVEGKFDKSELAHFNGSINEMMSIAKTEGEKMFREDSKELFTGIQKFMEKVPGLKDSQMANSAVVGDAFDAMNKQMTIATQAKPWAPIRNFFQLNLLGAIVGDNTEVWKAAKEVIDEPASRTIGRVTRSGAVADTLYTQGIDRERLNLWHRLMKWNENIDVLTRATAFKVAENLIDKYHPKLKAGDIDAELFFKKTGLDVLDEQMRTKVYMALERGDKTFAVDQLGNQFNSLTLFDYSKMNKSAVQRGFMGKLFGKFGTYPLGTLALYQRILTEGSPASRIGRMTRLAVTSMAIYEGFKLAGIDYKGFLWTDPFSFSGGPVWGILTDGSTIIGDTAEAKMARQSLLTSLPRLMSPEVNTLYQIQKAMKWLDQGDVYSAALALTGAPVRKDVAWAKRSQGQ